MKKSLLLFISVLVMWQGAFAITINCTAGSLNLAAVSSGLYTATDLKITGTMDSRDFTFIQYYVPLLTTLDLSSVSIAAYSGNLANAIPATAFTPISPNNYTKNLNTITLPSNLASIGAQAFYGCIGLTTVNIPSTLLTSIGTGAFYGCTNLATINIPSSVITLGASTFYGCSKLTSITIPSPVTAIGNAVFSGCTGLTTIYANNPLPVDLSSSTYAFYNVNKTTCILHVPVGAKLAYQAAVVWQDFLIEEGLQASVSNTISSPLKVYSTHLVIVIEGTSVGDAVSVYNLIGKQLQTIHSNGERLVFPINQNGIYLVKTATQIVKVII